MTQDVKEPTEMSRQGLHQWLRAIVEEGQCPGVLWDTREEWTFRIPWRNQKSRYWEEADSKIFLEYAKHTNKYRSGDEMDFPKWKQNLKSAINKNRFIERLKHRDCLGGPKPYRVYKFVSNDSPHIKSSVTPPEAESAMDLEDHENIYEEQCNNQPSYPSSTISTPPASVWSPPLNMRDDVHDQQMSGNIPELDGLLSEEHKKAVQTGCVSLVNYLSDETQTSDLTSEVSGWPVPFPGTNTVLDQAGMEIISYDRVEQPANLQFRTLNVLTQQLIMMQNKSNKNGHLQRPVQLQPRTVSETSGEQAMEGICFHYVNTGPQSSSPPTSQNVEVGEIARGGVMSYLPPNMSFRDSNFTGHSQLPVNKMKLECSDIKTTCADFSGQSLTIECAPTDQKTLLKTPASNSSHLSYRESAQSACHLTADRRDDDDTGHPLMHLQVLYGTPHYVACSKTLTSKWRSCRLFHGSINTKIIQDIIDVSEDNLQIELPAIEAFRLNGERVKVMSETLEQFELGIILHYENNDIYADRRCRHRVFCSDGVASSKPLTRSNRKRSVKEKIFDYAAFQLAMKKHKEDANNPVPRDHVLLTIGREILPNDDSPTRHVPFYFVVRHHLAANERFQILGATSISSNPMYSDPNSFDKITELFKDVDLKKREPTT